MKNFSVSRLNSARSLRRLTKTRLAELCNITTRSLALYEKQEMAPEDFLQAAAQVLGFPHAYFFSSVPLPEVDPGSVSFRSAARMPAATRDAALAAGQLAVLLHDRMDSEFVIPRVDLPELSLEFGPEAAAADLRASWGLGELKISNVIHLLELKGVRVFSLAIDSPHVDAFSMWRDGVPFVFLNCFKSSERSRFDACHELAHLVLHRGSEVRGKEAEAEADAFASAFLMPRASVLAAGVRAPTLSSLVELKNQWGVSVAALVTRLKGLGFLTEWQYRSLYIEMSKRGYLRSEPNSCRRESSQVMGKIFEVLRKEGRASSLPRELGLDPTDLNGLTFGLALAVHSNPHQVASSAQPGRPPLRLVSSSTQASCSAAGSKTNELPGLASMRSHSLFGRRV